jgi:hypothetical protein
MSDWTMQPRNEIENKLQAAGYRVEYGANTIYTALAPDGKELHISRRSVDDCWTACYQHSKKEEMIKEDYAGDLDLLIQYLKGATFRDEDLFVRTDLGIELYNLIAHLQNVEIYAPWYKSQDESEETD